MCACGCTCVFDDGSRRDIERQDLSLYFGFRAHWFNGQWLGVIACLSYLFKKFLIISSAMYISVLAVNDRIASS